MVDPKKILVGCVVTPGNRNYANIETEYLFKTLNKFGGSLRSAQKMACFIEQPDPLLASVLDNLGVKIQIIEPIDNRDPFSNKVPFLGQACKEDVDFIVYLDTDIVLTNDFSSFITGDYFQAKIVNSDPLGVERWKRLFQYFDLEFPKERFRTFHDNRETIPYFASGQFIIPKKHTSKLFDTWKNFTLELNDEKENFQDVLKFAKKYGQIALTLSIFKNKIPYKPLPLKMGYSVITVKPDESPENLEPIIIHYHHRISKNGDILPSPYDKVNKKIDEINQFLKNQRRLVVETTNILPFQTGKLIAEKNYKEVIKKLGKLPLDNNQSSLHFHLALAFFHTNQNLEEALDRLNAALKFGHNQFSVYFHRGLLCQKMGKKEMARDDLRKAHKLKPDNKKIIRLLSSLEKNDP